MQPRPTIVLTSEDKAVCVKWSFRILSIWAVIVIATLTLPIFGGESANVSRGQAKDHAASEFPSGRVDHFTRDAAVKR